MASELHLFAIWPFARSHEDRILADIAEHAQIVSTFVVDWPRRVSAECGYRRFYGPLLPDAVGKAKRAGRGKFRLVIVRIANPRYDWRLTQRGYELVNLDMFDMKWRYRGWVGGNHRVHNRSSSVGRIVIDDEHIKLVLGHPKHGIDDVTDVFLLVIGRNDY